MLQAVERVTEMLSFSVVRYGCASKYTCFSVKLFFRHPTYNTHAHINHAIIQQYTSKPFRRSHLCYKALPSLSPVGHPPSCFLGAFFRSALSEDLALCATFLDLDGRNFHCWAHRMWVAERMGLSAQEEFDFTTDKIKQVHSTVCRLLLCVYAHDIYTRTCVQYGNLHVAWLYFVVNTPRLW